MTQNGRTKRLGEALGRFRPHPGANTTPLRQRPVFWLAFILVCQPSHVQGTQWRKAELSGLQQRGLRRNGREGWLTTSPDFPFHLAR